MFKKFWKSLRGWFEPVYKISRVVQKPKQMDRYTVYLIVEDDSPWAAVLTCPCGCRADVWLNLLESPDRPTWTVDSIQNGKAHITPSVWRQTGCRSHFLIKRGKVIWVGKQN